MFPTHFHITINLPILILSTSLVFVISSLHLNPSPWSNTNIFRSFPKYSPPPPPFPPKLDSLSHSPPVFGCQDRSDGGGGGGEDVVGAQVGRVGRQKAAILVLIRDTEDDLRKLVGTLKNFESSFNARFGYPYVFLTDPASVRVHRTEREQDLRKERAVIPTQSLAGNGIFSERFVRTVRQVLGEEREVEWGLIPEEHWSIPSWLDERKVREAIERQGRERVQYGGKESYHHMCRWYSGFFARHPLLQKYDYYWRVEPDVRFYTDVTYDPFQLLSTRQKLYGFVITIKETPNTIPTLFRSVEEYALEKRLVGAHGRRVEGEEVEGGGGGTRGGGKGVWMGKAGWNGMRLWDFVAENEVGDAGEKVVGKVKGKGEASMSLTGKQYNRCHFWTNFEIGDLRFFRSKEYQEFFEHLDRAGGFFLERWGDAPVRTLGLALLADVDRVHYFEDIGYVHDWFSHCPKKEGLACNVRCKQDMWWKDQELDRWIYNIDPDEDYTCLPLWKEIDARIGP